MNSRSGEEPIEVLDSSVIKDILNQIVIKQAIFNKRFLQELREQYKNFNEDTFIKELRKQLLLILNDEIYRPLYSAYVYHHVYFTLLYLGKHWPFNARNEMGEPIDYSSHERILQRNLLITSTGFHFDVDYNIAWFRNNSVNPSNRQRFNSRDRDQLESMLPPPPPPEIHWGAHLPSAAGFMLAGAVLDGTVSIGLVAIIAAGTAASFIALLSVTWPAILIFAAVTATFCGILSLCKTNFFGEVTDRYQHFQNLQHPAPQINIHDRIADMEHARNIPNVPRVTPSHNPALSPFYDNQKKSVNGSKISPQKGQAILPTTPPVKQLFHLPENSPKQLELIMKTLNEKIEQFSSDREICSGLKNIKNMLEKISDPKFTSTRIQINISWLIVKISTVEKKSKAVEGELNHYHTCIDFLRELQSAIPKLKQNASEESLTKLALKSNTPS